MFTKTFTRLAAVGLALAVQMSGAMADPVVTGTTASGYAGETVHPTLTITFDNSLDAAHIASWVFTLNWDAAPLTLDTALSTISIGGATPLSLDDYVRTVLYTNSVNPVVTSNPTNYSFVWFDESFFGIDLSDGIFFTAAFDIASGAVAGQYDIFFGIHHGNSDSGFTDASNPIASSFEYASVTNGQSPMQVVVSPNPSQIPEPGTLSLLAVALLGIHFATRRGRSLLV